MSFLFSRKKIFLFLLLLLISFSINTSCVYADDDIGSLEGVSANLSAFSENGEAPEVLGVKHEPGKGLPELPKLSDFAIWVMEGVIAATLPLASLFALIPTALVYGLSSLGLGIATTGFDLIIEIGVKNLSKMANDPFVHNAWTIFRNLSNVVIIFSIIYIAIGTILRASGYTKLLGKVIIAALLINFSFFFGALVVDVSNVMANTIYKKIQNHVTKDGHEGIASYLNDKLSPDFFYLYVMNTVDKNSATAASRKYPEISPANASDIFSSMALWPMRMILGYTLGIISNMVMAVVLYVAIFMILSRMIVILFLLATAPVAFGAMILPSTKKISDEWWQTLLSQSFFLPIFLLFLLIALQLSGIIDSGNLRSDSNINLLNAFSLSNLAKIFVPYIFQYLLVIGMFIVALILAKKVATSSGESYGKISTMVTGATAGASAAGLAFMGRNTIGAGANIISNNKKVQESLRKMNPIVGGLIGKQLQGVAKASFDVRNSRAFQGVASATGVGKDFNGTLKPQKDGFKGQTERLAKSLESTYNAIPDRKDDHPEVAVAKQNAEDAKIVAENAVNEYKKAASATYSSQADADAAKKLASDKIELAKKDRDEAYQKLQEAKNPAKARFIEKSKAESRNPIVNVWLKPATKQVSEKFDKALREKEDKNHKEMMEALKNMKSSE